MVDLSSRNLMPILKALVTFVQSQIFDLSLNLSRKQCSCNSTITSCFHEPLQSAYKALRSAETALIRVHNDIVLSVDSGQSVILVLLDMSAAFDTVNHEILLTVKIAPAFWHY